MLNKVEIIGRVGQDIELETTSSGKVYAVISIATNNNYTDAQGNKVEQTDWHRIKAWGKTAELFHQYSGKGRLVRIEGKLSYSEYEKDGVKRYSTEVLCNNVLFLDRPKDSAQPNVQPANVAQAQTPQGESVTPDAQPQVNNDFTGDDIPF